MSNGLGLVGSPVQGGEGVPRCGVFHSPDAGPPGTEIHLLLRAAMICNALGPGRGKTVAWRPCSGDSEFTSGLPSGQEVSDGPSLLPQARERDPRDLATLVEAYQ